MYPGEFPFEIEYPRGHVDDMTPSWPNVIDDCVSRGKFYLRIGGAAYAYSQVGDELKAMSMTKHWRAEEAAKLYLRINREMLAEVPLFNSPIMAVDMVQSSE